MPDDNLRPTHGLPPESRSANTPPAWWALLDRVDLPESSEETRPSGGNRWRSEVARGRAGPGTGRRWPTILLNLAGLLAAALLIILGLSVTAGATAATLLVCGMVAFLGLIGVGVARRIGRRW